METPGSGPPEPFWWLFALAWGWMALVVVASVFYRRAKGRPIWYPDEARTLFVEKRASGNSHRTWYTKLGGANNVLFVAVTPEALVVRPHFPFNLMFIPEMYGLESRVPLGQLRSVETTRKMGQDVVDIEFETLSGATERVTLRLRHRAGFLEALSTAALAAGDDSVRAGLR